MQKTLAPAYEKETGVKVTYEIDQRRQPADPRQHDHRDRFGRRRHDARRCCYPFLYADKLMDVSDIADEIGKKQGGWYDVGKEAGIVDGKWKAIPFSNIGQLMNWRTDWFKEVGVTKFPDTWEELYEVGKKLKAKDHPFGFELGHGFGDNHGWLYPLLWSYGGHEVEKPTARPCRSTRRKRRRRSISPASSSRTRCSTTSWLDRRQQQQGVDGRADLVHQQRREHSVARQARLPRYRQGHRPGDEPAGAEGPVPSDELDQPRRSSTSRRKSRRRTISCAG